MPLCVSKRSDQGLTYSTGSGRPAPVTPSAHVPSSTCTHMLPATLLGRPWHLRLTDEETEAPQVKDTCPRLHGQRGAEPGREPG